MQARDPQPRSPRLIRRPAVLARVGLSASSVYEMIANGDFPAPIPIGRQAVAWLEHEVDAWINQRIAMRDLRREGIPLDTSER